MVRFKCLNSRVVSTKTDVRWEAGLSLLKDLLQTGVNEETLHSIHRPPAREKGHLRPDLKSFVQSLPNGGQWAVGQLSEVPTEERLDVQDVDWPPPKAQAWPWLYLPWSISRALPPHREGFVGRQRCSGDSLADQGHTSVWQAQAGECRTLPTHSLIPSTGCFSFQELGQVTRLNLQYYPPLQEGGVHLGPPAATRPSRASSLFSCLCGRSMG